MKKLYTSPLVLLVLCLSILPACSRSKSRDNGRVTNNQRTFSDRGDLGRDIPDSNTWTSEEKLCVERVQRENRDPRECFNNGNSRRDINDPRNFDERDRNGGFVDLDKNGVDDRTDRQNRERENNNSGEVRTNKNGEWVKSCRQRKAAHRDHLRHRAGEKCGVCEEVCEVKCTGKCDEVAEESSEDCGSKCTSTTGSRRIVHVDVEVSSRPTPPNYSPAPVAQNNGGSYPTPPGYQPAPVGQVYQPAPTYNAPPSTYKPAPQPYQPAPQPYKPAPVAQNTAPSYYPAPSAPAPVVPVGPSAPNIPAKGGSGYKPAPAPIAAPAPAAPIATGNGMGICGGKNSSDPNYRMLLQLAVFRNQNTRAGDALLSAGESAFAYISNFNSAKVEAKVMIDVKYNIGASSTSTAGNPLVPVELAETLALKLIPLETHPCDIDDTGECIIIEKDTARRGSSISVYGLASDHKKDNPQAYYRIGTIKYYRQDVTNAAVIAAAEKALADDPNGYYLFSRAEVKNPVQVVCGNRGALTGGPVQSAGAYPATSAGVAQVGSAAAVVSTPAQVYPTEGAGVKSGAPLVVSGDGVAQEGTQAQYEAEYVQLEAQHKAVLQERIDANCTRRASEDRIHGAPASFLYKRPEERTLCDRDPIATYKREQEAQISSVRRGGVIYFCMVKLNYTAPVSFIGLMVNNKVEGEGKVYCKPSNGGPVQVQKIFATETQGLSVGLKAGTTNNTLIATGIGWADGADGIVEIRKFPYLIQANAAVPFLGGIGATPIIFGNNKINGQGPILALAVTWIRPFTFSLQAQVNLFGNWMIGIDG